MASPQRVAPTIASTFAAGAQARGAVRARHGPRRHAIRDANNLLREPGSCGVHPNSAGSRSVSNIPRAFAVQSMVGEIAAATDATRRRTLLALIGSPHRIVKPAVKDMWNYASPLTATRSTPRALRKVVELFAEKGEWGVRCPRATASHCRAPQLRQLHRDHRRGGRRRQGKLRCAAGRHRDRLAAPMSNPERIASQIEGAAIMGLSLAKYGRSPSRTARWSRRTLTTSRSSGWTNLLS